MRFILAERVRAWRLPSETGLLLAGFCLGVGALQWQVVLPECSPASLLAFALFGTLFVALGGLDGVLDGRHRFAGRVSNLLPFAIPVAISGSILPILRLMLGMALSVALGFSWAAWRADHRLADQLPVEWERRDIRVVGIIAELPREFERGRRFVFETEQVETPDAVVPKKILLSWFDGAHEDQWLDERALLPGERWRFTVRLKRPHGNANPGGFDYEAWLLERGLRATGYVRAKPGAERLGEAWSIATVIERARARLRQHLQKNLDNATFAGVIIALALGDQGSIDRDHWRIFAATGTTHLMSISGLHITMMAALFGGMVNYFWRRQPRGMLLIPAQRMAVLSGWMAAFAYTLLAGAGIPAVRTLLMLSVAALAHTLDRQVSAPRILLLALFAVLAFDPWAVLVVGFWLSFAAVAVLLFFANEDASPAENPDSSALNGAPGRSRPSKIMTAVRLLRTWAWTQWVVTLGTVPLLLLMFQTLSLASPLANAIAIPLVGFLIAPLSVAASLLPLPWLADLSHMLLDWLMWPLEFLAAQPWALWKQAEPSIWAVILAVVGVLLHFVLRHWAGRLAALILVLPLVLWPPSRPKAGVVWIDLLDVGQGLSALVRTTDYNLLFDTGPRYSPDASAGERLVLPALRALGVTRVDGLVISHQDNDHAGGLWSVAAELPVGWMASSLPETRAAQTRNAIPQVRCQRGQQFEWNGVRFSFVSPPPTYYGPAEITSNRLSCVLRIESAGRVALLTGDAEASEEQAMLAAGELAGVDVLQVAHHGSRTSSSPDFVAAIAPKWALFPVGYRNPFAHPHPDVLARYREAGAQVLQTDQDGALHVEIGKDISVSSQRQRFPRYWHGR